MISKIDIGSIIKDAVKAEGISVAEFAEQIHCTERNVYKIFNKPSIDTHLLGRINKALGKNLFVYYLYDTNNIANNIISPVVKNP